ncbi:hypothetical protein TSAR_015516 [Trichomalopsis sarcophagae]|uniref:Reverse transcriptase Ty1/copia-type domain-containing protein n=1 Tax=Trichomalopsis sarcophagae TaxID=543379 RepID=A0A232EZN1_9HYME|nr:hypothetical protein TSAR_015516 [Trichomalopsis sarcophagae]
MEKFDAKLDTWPEDIARIKEEISKRHTCRPLNVETDFLQGNLEEDGYIQQPEGYVDPYLPNKVCKLRKAIYELKQSGRVWNIKLDGVLKVLGLSQSIYGPCVYMLSQNEDYCQATRVSYLGCDLSNGRSTTGFVSILQGGTVSWLLTKQKTPATFSTVAEYQALSSAAVEAFWLRGLAMELKIQNSDPIVLMYNNKGAVDLGRNAKFSQTTKHVLAKHHFIKDSLDNRQIEITYISTQDMVADQLTKPVLAPKIHKFLLTVGLMRPQEKF